MSIASFVSSLKHQVSSKTQILTDPENPDFKTCLERWSNVDIQVPGAIICPATQSDVEIIVSHEVADSWWCLVAEDIRQKG
jgi:hypothetical protein